MNNINDSNNRVDAIQVDDDITKDVNALIHVEPISPIDVESIPVDGTSGGATDESSPIGVQASSSNAMDESSSIPVTQELLGITVTSIEEAFNLYNDYAFRLGFSVRKGKQYYVSGSQTIKMKKFHCAKSGFKDNKKKDSRSYSRVDTRTGCNAFCQFDLASNGQLIVTKHVKDHNHELCPPSNSYLLRSHRSVVDTQLDYLKNLKRSGVALSDGIRFLKHQSGGSPLVGFTPRDAYNSLHTDSIKRLDGTDSNSLIEIFRQRQSNEPDFFFDFELDEDARLCNFFWRDTRMKEDFVLFGDLVVHDTTYRTNKYDMICGPFVGMNHHCMNIMFGCGFLLNKRTDSFVWLFKTFLRAMGGKCPQTIMTDQCAAMSAAISLVFPSARHRLCIWHIGENSKKHIKCLRSQNGFMELFNFLLKYTDTEAEFEFYWNRLVTNYNCHKNVWLNKLYDIREKWCPAFNKDYFSGGILSSQRSETTNHSISKRLSKTSGLSDFYNSFVNVVSEWRSKENGEDVRCSQGLPTMALDHVKLLLHARNVYTIEAYYLFEQQFLKGAACHQESVASNVDELKYHIWRPDIDIIRHEVCFNIKDMNICCTCKFFSEMGILCSHCLRILNIHCVEKIPEKYICRRWTKKVVEHRIMDIASSSSILTVASPIWVIDMGRKWQRLVLSSQDNCKARQVCENLIEDGRRRIEGEVGPICFDDLERSMRSNAIQNPERSGVKGDRNRRPVSTVQKKYNQASGRKNYAKRVESNTKAAVQSSMQEVVSNIVGSGYLVHPNDTTSSELICVRSKSQNNSNDN
ncbi:PREDICTED: protein FAR1-RELATED SEQUENCE 5-like [Ipomoea nil]|uniref:protein FAR1-RELATED SEQUENCE 5-like n=1 Tax=Ipomoea nil TaxID=35883 RepID=UPI0009011FC0|nr:PREDICTED: protein FAR1-RELATED SEQUENCE 5-like [Ipomoea nil]